MATHLREDRLREAGTHREEYSTVPRRNAKDRDREDQSRTKHVRNQQPHKPVYKPIGSSKHRMSMSSMSSSIYDNSTTATKEASGRGRSPTPKAKAKGKPHKQSMATGLNDIANIPTSSGKALDKLTGGSGSRRVFTEREPPSSSNSSSTHRNNKGQDSSQTNEPRKVRIPRKHRNVDESYETTEANLSDRDHISQSRPQPESRRRYQHEEMEVKDASKPASSIEPKPSLNSTSRERPVNSNESSTANNRTPSSAKSKNSEAPTSSSSSSSSSEERRRIPRSPAISAERSRNSPVLDRPPRTLSLRSSTPSIQSNRASSLLFDSENRMTRNRMESSPLPIAKPFIKDPPMQLISSPKPSLKQQRQFYDSEDEDQSPQKYDIEQEQLSLKSKPSKKSKSDDVQTVPTPSTEKSHKSSKKQQSKPIPVVENEVDITPTTPSTKSKKQQKVEQPPQTDTTTTSTKTKPKPSKKRKPFHMVPAAKRRSCVLMITSPKVKEYVRKKAMQEGINQLGRYAGIPDVAVVTPAPSIPSRKDSSQKNAFASALADSDQEFEEEDEGFERDDYQVVSIVSKKTDKKKREDDPSPSSIAHRGSKKSFKCVDKEVDGSNRSLKSSQSREILGGTGKEESPTRKVTSKNGRREDLDMEDVPVSSSNSRKQSSKNGRYVEDDEVVALSFRKISNNGHRIEEEDEKEANSSHKGSKNGRRGDYLDQEFEKLSNVKQSSKNGRREENDVPPPSRKEVKKKHPSPPPSPPFADSGSEHAFKNVSKPKASTTISPPVSSIKHSKKPHQLRSPSISDQEDTHRNFDSDESDVSPTKRKAKPNSSSNNKNRFSSPISKSNPDQIQKHRSGPSRRFADSVVSSRFSGEEFDRDLDETDDSAFQFSVGSPPPARKGGMEKTRFEESVDESDVSRDVPGLDVPPRAQKRISGSHDKRQKSKGVAKSKSEDDDDDDDKAESNASPSSKKSGNSNKKSTKSKRSSSLASTPSLDNENGSPKSPNSRVSRLSIKSSDSHVPLSPDDPRKERKAPSPVNLAPATPPPASAGFLRSLWRSATGAQPATPSSSPMAEAAIAPYAAPVVSQNSNRKSVSGSVASRNSNISIAPPSARREASSSRRNASSSRRSQSSTRKKEESVKEKERSTAAIALSTPAPALALTPASTPVQQSRGVLGWVFGSKKPAVTPATTLAIQAEPKIVGKANVDPTFSVLSTASTTLSVALGGKRSDDEGGDDDDENEDEEASASEHSYHNKSSFEEPRRRPPPRAASSGRRGMNSDSDAGGSLKRRPPKPPQHVSSRDESRDRRNILREPPATKRPQPLSLPRNDTRNNNHSRNDRRGGGGGRGRYPSEERRYSRDNLFASEY
ncbi:UNVERIFIED_CONTAM: hypothetical protein HDU68_007476 [Siphonaria sp. JEL0065]|nr:hypothetical protein HDU68_007476 [Siphonaria sp. JEL0065]